MSRDINEYFHKHCDKMSCEECEMENDQKEEYTCYHQGFYVKGYEQGRADEREKIVAILKENSYEVDIDCPPYQETIVSLTDILEVLAESEIVRGGD